MGFKTISDNQNFYLQNNQLVITFNKYEIAPGAEGEVEFKIPLGRLNNYLEDQFKDNSISEHALTISTKLVDMKIKYPEINCLKDKEYEKHLNNEIKAMIFEEVLNIWNTAQKDVLEFEKEGWEFRPYQLYVDYEIKMLTNEMMSFGITIVPYTGGTGNYTIKYYNIKNDIKAKELTLKDIFKENVNFKEIINRKIKEQINKELKIDQGKYFKGDFGFKGISDEQKFYMKNNNIVVVFDKYEIAPGSIGTPEFIIPNKLH